MNSLQIGDTISWVSAAGYKEGKIKNIVLSKNANDKLVPWIDVEYRVAKATCFSEEIFGTVRLNATERNMEMLKFTKIFA